MYELSLEEWAGEAEYALAEAEEAAAPSEYPASFGGRSKTVLSLWKRHLDYLNTRSYESALRFSENHDPVVRARAQAWLRDRDDALRFYCNNPTCPEWNLPYGPTRLVQPKTGRPRRYCGDKCRDSAKKRAQRNAEDPNRFERGIVAMQHSLEKPRFVFGGNHGRHRYTRRRKASEGFRSVLSPEVVASGKLTSKTVGDHLDRQNGWNPKDQERVEASPAVQNGRNLIGTIRRLDRIDRAIIASRHPDLADLCR